MSNLIKDIFRAKMSPTARLEFGFDWADFGSNDASSDDPGWLQGDTLSDSTWDFSGPDAVLTIESDTNDDTTTAVVVLPGTENSVYSVTNHITTTAGWEDDRTIEIRIAK